MEKRNGDNRESWAGNHGLNGRTGGLKEGKAEKSKPVAERLRSTVERLGCTRNMDYIIGKLRDVGQVVLLPGWTTAETNRTGRG